MAVSQSHIIRKQNVKVHATGHDAFALRRKIEIMVERLSDKMNSIFDELVSENEVLLIDKLDLQIDNISENKLEEKLLTEIINQIREKIYSGIYSINSSGKNKKNGFGLVPVHQRALEAFLYFLQNGILPWWFETTSHSALEEQILKAFDEVESELKVYSFIELLENTSAKARLAIQFNDRIFFRVVQILVNDSINYNQVKKTSDALLQALSTGNVPDNIKKRLLIKNKTIILSSVSKRTDLIAIFTYWSERFVCELQLLFPEMTIKEKAVLEKAFFTDAWNEIIKSASLTEINFFEKIRNAISANHDSFLLPAINLTDSNYKNSISDLPKDQEKAKTNSLLNLKKEEEVKFTFKSKKLIEELETSDGAIISNAGLVLVAPFLSRLFSQCNVLINDQITDHSKATAILHYCVFGNCEYREYDVLLNKILLGMEGDESIELVEQLPEMTVSAIEDMLAAAIGHWAALKKTSPDGLREGFLIRKGKLVHKYDEWFLQVENNTIDILLQQLPWTIGFVKLPWMKKILRTQWV